MKDKLKLVLLLVVFAAVGIAIVLGSWLYGSYSQRMGLFAAVAEQSLFEAVQNVAQEIEKSYPDSVIEGVQSPRQAVLVDAIAKEFPTVRKDRLAGLVDSLLFDRHSAALAHLDSMRMQHEKNDGKQSSFYGKQFGPEGRFPRRRLQLIPFTLSRGAFSSESTIRQIEEKFDAQLNKNKIHTSYHLSVEKLGMPENSSRYLTGRPDEDLLAIRPLLIDPQQGQFIVVYFDQPWQLILYSMSWQLLVSIFILAIVLGTFFYLFITIIKQNKLDMLRKAFVNSLTHELRTPVTTVIVALEALHDYFDIDNAETREEYYQMAIEELDHLSLMIDRVLDIADGDHNEERMMQTAQIDFSDLVTKCVDHARFITASKDVSIVLKKSSTEPLFLHGDPHHLKNVLNNLLDNAVKYGASQVAVLLEALESKGAVVLHVEDNGIGIPVAYQQQVFEAFFRVPRGDLYSVKGFGLGLPYVRRVLTQHGGKIQLKSELGKGTTFSIEIPNKRP